MRTIVFTWDKESDVYNESINEHVSGNPIDWKNWYNGDSRHKETWAEVGDRYFLYQIGRGIISAGTIGETHFVRGKSKLSNCGMVHIELIPDIVGEPLIPSRQVEEILANTEKRYDKSEIVIDNMSDVAKLEILWLKVIFENSSSCLNFAKDFWLPTNLHEQTVYAIHRQLLSDPKRCVACGNDLNRNNLLVFRPMINILAHKPITSYKDLLSQYAVLCKECAAIEMKLH